MLFACGVSTGLFFYGVAEPVFHYIGAKTHMTLFYKTLICKPPKRSKSIHCRPKPSGQPTRPGGDQHYLVPLVRIYSTTLVRISCTPGEDSKLKFNFENYFCDQGSPRMGGVHHCWASFGPDGSQVMFVHYRHDDSFIIHSTGKEDFLFSPCSPKNLSHLGRVCLLQ